MGFNQFVIKNVEKKIEQNNPNMYSAVASIVGKDKDFVGVVGKNRARLLAAEGAGLSPAENIKLLQELGIDVGLAGGPVMGSTKIAGSEVTVKEFTDLLAKLIQVGAIK